ncbi:MAG: serine acetyltransferase [Bacteroidetes bacterium]|nr:MAG: serine acetyltransferase [Bacteroidota bacterium]
MLTQLRFFAGDVKRMAGKKKLRVAFIWLNRSFCGIFSYRLDRSLFLFFGKTYRIIRIPLIPLFNIWQAYSNIDIHYEAEIGPGINILHCSMGVVVSGKSLIGKNLTLTGGNVIGAKTEVKPRQIVLGDNCSMGANAVVLGPITIGSNVKIGAMALVVKNCGDNVTLIGVPAKEV